MDEMDISNGFVEGSSSPPVPKPLLMNITPNVKDLYNSNGDANKSWSNFSDSFDTHVSCQN